MNGGLGHLLLALAGIGAVSGLAAGGILPGSDAMTVIVGVLVGGGVVAGSAISTTSTTPTPTPPAVPPPAPPVP